MKRPTKLTASFVRRVARPGVYTDGRGGHGLYLSVRAGANERTLKSWGQKVRIHGRVTALGLGPYPVVTLAKAREKALQNAREVADGRDPRRGGIPSFEIATEAVIRLRRQTWKPGGRSEQQWRSAFEAHVFPQIGGKRVSKITSGDVLALLTADDLWNRRRATARRLLQWIGLVFKRAIAEGHRGDNPVDAIRAALPSNGHRVKHQRAIHHREVAEALNRVRASKSRPATRLCLEFLVLTATRSAEARNARWSQVQGDVWTIPETGTKAGREHRIPLSSAALAVLAEAKRHSTGDLIFPGVRGGVIGGKTLSELPRAVGVEAVPHGFRTSARSWMADQGISREVAEACLGHVVANQAEAAYRHGTDLLDRRREALEAWGDHVAPTRNTG